MMSRGWSFSTPRRVSGMAGSCIIIPCSFVYTRTRPAQLTVKWYVYDSRGYPADSGKYRGGASAIGFVGDGNCSLQIERLEMSLSQDRLYPWVDENPITSYHSAGQSFFDKTTQIIVSDYAKEPQLSFIGIPTVGAQSRVSCSVQHSCISAPPGLTVSGVQGQDNTQHTLLSEGVWEKRVERVWTVSEHDQRVRCTVSHTGGQKATSELELNIQCPHEPITMVQRPRNLTEGTASYVVCSVSYKCKKNAPEITWNFGNMQSKTDTRQLSKDTYLTVSNITFIGSLSDHGKPLTCTAHFHGAKTSDSETLHITRYQKPENSLEEGILPADVPFRVSALSRSCVVIPCSYENPHDLLLTRGIWSKQSGGVVYHNGPSRVLDHFRHRTRIVGDLQEGDCSLEIDDIKPFDNGPFCFTAERGNTAYRFNNSCAFVIMKASPEKPVMTNLPPEAEAGSALTVSCSVTHTCPTRPPQFMWSIAPLTNGVTHTSLRGAVWGTTSKISFIVPEGDGTRSVTCTAHFWGQKQESGTRSFNVKGSLIYQMRKSAPVAAPVSLLVLIVIIVAVVFGVNFCKKRISNDSLTPPPRPTKRRSLFDRLTRMDATDRPPRPEKRRSFWQRFSRRGDGRAACDRGRTKKQNSTAVSVGYVNNAVLNDRPITFKPRCPSPKNVRRGDHTMMEIN